MLLKEVVSICQGSILTRIKSNNALTQSYKTITMQGLSYYLNLSNIPEEDNVINVIPEKLSTCCIAKKGDVVIGLSSGKAMPIEQNDDNKIVLSNFALLRISNVSNIDPYYLCWYINENPNIQKSILSSIQGTSRVRILPISMVGDFEIKIPDLKKQKIIGKVYNLNRQRVRLERNIERKKTELNLALILKYYEGE